MAQPTPAELAFHVDEVGWSLVSMVMRLKMSKIADRDNHAESSQAGFGGAMLHMRAILEFLTVRPDGHIHGSHFCAGWDGPAAARHRGLDADALHKELNIHAAHLSRQRYKVKPQPGWDPLPRVEQLLDTYGDLVDCSTLLQQELYDYLTEARRRRTQGLVANVHERSFGTYGVLRVTPELRSGVGRLVNHKRVEWLMRDRGLQTLVSQLVAFMEVASVSILIRAAAARLDGPTRRRVGEEDRMVSRLRLASELLGQPVELTKRVAEQYPFKLSTFLAGRLAAGDYSLEAARQFLPDGRELLDWAGAEFDPCNEDEFRQTDTVIQRYDNRAAIVLTQKCLVYCRFCFRRDFVGFNDNAVSDESIDDGIAFLEATPEIRDVLLTGGDPLALANVDLIRIVNRITAIDHIRVIRVHTRALSVDPARIDADLVDAFAASGKIWFYTHMNHPDDLDHSDVRSALRRLRSAGVPVLNQAVILGGVNDGFGVLAKLMSDCYESQIIPYHLYVLDRVPGAEHFDVSPDRVIEVLSELSSVSGPAQPVLVIVDRTDMKHRVVPSALLDEARLRTLLERRTLSSEGQP